MKLKVLIGFFLIVIAGQSLLSKDFIFQNGVSQSIKGKTNSERPLYKGEVSCPPNASEKFLQLKKSNQLIDHDESEGIYYNYEEVYNYLIFSTDSIGKKRIVKMGESTVVVSWEQKFSHGLKYRYEELESGGEGTLYSKCTDKSSFLNAIEPVIKFIPFENWYDYNPIWNSDSTTYSPADEGAGCYYNIEKDKQGFFMLSWYCGC